MLLISNGMALSRNRIEHFICMSIVRTPLPASPSMPCTMCYMNALAHTMSVLFLFLTFGDGIVFDICND